MGLSFFGMVDMSCFVILVLFDLEYCFVGEVVDFELWVVVLVG